MSHLDRWDDGYGPRDPDTGESHLAHTIARLLLILEGQP